MRRAVFFGVLIASAASAACEGPETQGATSTTASYPLSGGVARVCAIRAGAMARNVTMPLRDNGQLVGATRGATYVCWLAAAGEHQITSVDDDTGPTLLQARAGGRYWLQQDVTELEGAVHAHLDWVDDTTAADLIDACEHRVRVAVPGHEDEPGAMTIAPAKSQR
jgi:hypothetical protein